MKTGLLGVGCASNPRLEQKTNPFAGFNFSANEMEKRLDLHIGTLKIMFCLNIFVPHTEFHVSPITQEKQATLNKFIIPRPLSPNQNSVPGDSEIHVFIFRCITY
jgi:hypothetical protein